MATTERRRARSRRGDGAALRAELVAAADAILDEVGDPEQLTVRGVTAAVGVAPNAFYLHFADRDSLLTELAILRFAECTERVRRAVSDVEDPLERLLVGHEEYCRLALERPGHYRLLFRNRLHPGDPESLDRLVRAGLDYFQLCIDGCAACLDAGLLRAESPVALASAVWALQHGWCELMLTGMGSNLLGSPRDVLLALLEPS